MNKPRWCFRVGSNEAIMVLNALQGQGLKAAARTLHGHPKGSQFGLWSWGPQGCLLGICRPKQTTNGNWKQNGDCSAQMIFRSNMKQLWNGRTVRLSVLSLFKVSPMYSIHFGNYSEAGLECTWYILLVGWVQELEPGVAYCEDYHYWDVKNLRSADSQCVEAIVSYSVYLLMCHWRSELWFLFLRAKVVPIGSALQEHTTPWKGSLEQARTHSHWCQSLKHAEFVHIISEWCTRSF